MMNIGLTWLKIGSELPLLHVEAPFPKWCFHQHLIYFLHLRVGIFTAA